MSEFKRALLFITCLCLALCSFNNASAQEENRLSAREKNKTPAPEKIGRPDFGDGVLEEVTDKMERLLELEWKGDSIGLKRSWDKKKKASGDEEDFTSPLPRIGYHWPLKCLPLINIQSLRITSSYRV